LFSRGKKEHLDCVVMPQPLCNNRCLPFVSRSVQLSIRSEGRRRVPPMQMLEMTSLYAPDKWGIRVISQRDE
jgi:hypothetical protein